MFIFPSPVWTSLLVCPWIPVPGVERSGLSYSDPANNTLPSANTSVTQSNFEEVKGNNCKSDFSETKNLLKKCASLLNHNSNHQCPEHVCSLFQGKWVQEKELNDAAENATSQREMHDNVGIGCETKDISSPSLSCSNPIMVKLCGEVGFGVGILLSYIPSVEEERKSRSSCGSCDKESSAYTKDHATETASFWWCYESEQSVKDQLNKNYPALHIPVDRILQRLNHLTEKEAVLRSSGYWLSTTSSHPPDHQLEPRSDRLGGISLYNSSVSSLSPSLAHKDAGTSSSSYESSALLTSCRGVCNTGNSNAMSDVFCNGRLMTNEQESAPRRKRYREENGELVEMQVKHKSCPKFDSCMDVSSWRLECTLPIEVWKGSVVELTLKFECRAAQLDRQNSEFNCLVSDEDVDMNLSHQQLSAELLHLRLEREVLYKPLRAAVLSLSEAVLRQGRLLATGLTMPMVAPDAPNEQQNQQEVALTGSFNGLPVPLSATDHPPVGNLQHFFGNYEKKVELLGQAVAQQFIQSRSEEIAEAMTNERLDCIEGSSFEANPIQSNYFGSLTSQLKGQQAALENLMRSTLIQIPHQALYAFHRQCTSSIVQFSSLSYSASDSRRQTTAGSNCACASPTIQASLFNQKLLSEIQSLVNLKVTQKRLQKATGERQVPSHRWRREVFSKGRSQEGQGSVSRASSATPAPFPSRSSSRTGGARADEEALEEAFIGQVRPSETINVENPRVEMTFLEEFNSPHSIEQQNASVEKNRRTSKGSNLSLHDAKRSTNQDSVSDNIAFREEVHQPPNNSGATKDCEKCPKVSFLSAGLGESKEVTARSLPPAKTVSRRNLFL